MTKIDLYRYKVVMMSALLKGLQNQAAFLRHKRLVRRLGEAEVVIWVKNIIMIGAWQVVLVFFQGMLNFDARKK